MPLSKPPQRPQPSRSVSGNITFFYILSDGFSPVNANGTVTLVVPHAVPVAGPDVYACPRNAACTVNASVGLLANDASDNLNTNRAVLTGQTGPLAQGALTLQASGAFTFTPIL